MSIRLDVAQSNDNFLTEFLNSAFAESDYDGDYISHHGVGWDDNPPGIGSGRYPHGSGENPFQHDVSLSKMYSDLKKRGISTSDILKALKFKSTGELRAAISMESEARKKKLLETVPKMIEKGMSIKEISEALGQSQSTIRNYAAEHPKIKVDRNRKAADLLKEQISEKHYIDIGEGVQIGNDIGSQERMKTAVIMLMDEGYKQYYIKVPQLGNPGKYTTVHVLGGPDTTWEEVKNDNTLIKTIADYKVTDIDPNATSLGMLKPKSISSDRVYINYTNPDGTGGAEKEGLIEIRPGVEDISLGKSSYAQVRIGVDDTHYMKGMAVYSDNVPEGYDIIYNTNKKTGTDKYKVYKPMKTVDGKDDGPIDWANPFGATIAMNGQAYCKDKNGKDTDELRVINKVTDQGDWLEWKKQISAQVLGKQPVPLIRQQLELTYKDKETEFQELMALDNPTIKRKLLESFADDCDASAIHLKAKAFPGQASHVIIPVPSLEGGTAEYKRKHGCDGEIYAPNYITGELVAAIRYPHAGTFEIPILRVNNNNPEAKKMLGSAPDAVGFNSKIAERLSGADFDGDTVTLIPTKTANILSTPALRELVGFDTKQYKFKDDNAPGITSQAKQQEMGKVTNLIADMQYKGATPEEVARAVKHSMVVIDSEKHHLDWKQSEVDNGIKELKDKYQNGGGASTLITRAKSEVWVNQRKLGSVVGEDGKKHYGINPETGELILTETGETKFVKKGKGTDRSPIRYEEKLRQEKSTQMGEARTPEDVYNLMSSRTAPHDAELAYANYAIRCKELANKARKEMLKTGRLKMNPAAAKEYAKEVDSLNGKVADALKHAPVERQAQIIGNAEYKLRLEANPEIAGDKEKMKRLKGQCLAGARLALGGGKKRVEITDREWEAIQKGAISDSKLMTILNNTDSDALKKRATPRNDTSLSSAKESLARSWAALGYTQKEIAERLGVSTTTINKLLNS